MGLSPPAARLANCITTYLQPAVPGPTLEGVIAVVANHELYPKDLAPAVWQNPAYVQFILRVDFLQNRINEWIAESPEGQANYPMILTRIFTLLGKQASRNLVACVRLNRILGVIPRKPGDRMPLLPKEQLKHAIAAEDFCLAKSFAFSETAFLGGLHFDFLQAAFTRSKASREALGAFPVQWLESLRTAHYAYEIGSRLKSFKWNHTVFAAALVIGVGKILMTALYPKELGTGSWAGLHAECEKLKYGRWVQFDLQEKKRFEVTHAELASLAASFWRFLGPVELAIRHYQNPYYLKARSPDQYTVSSILCLAHALAVGRPFQEVHHRTLKSLGLPATAIQEIKNKVLAK